MRKYTSSLKTLCSQLSKACWLLVLILFCMPCAYAEHRELMGVATCASSNCHGSVRPHDSTTVLLNEYVTWSKSDKHSRAWLSLVSPTGKKIGKNLGLEQPEKDPTCLRCHATYSEDKSRAGSELHVEDGVGCESCHGAAQKYLRPHTTSDSTHKQNVALGMTDLSSLSVRANTCLSCHYGDQNAAITHRIMGAGHPRLSFELDTFTMVEPPHWRMDDDYAARKGEYNPVRAWLIGQIELARHQLAAWDSPTRSRTAIGMPEFTLLNCYSCHHSLSQTQSMERDYNGHPGELSLNAAPFFILQYAVKTKDQSSSNALADSLAAVHKTFRETGSVTTETSKNLSSALDTIEKVLLTQDSPPPSLKALLASMVSAGTENPYLQYEYAEQVAMSISSILSTLSPNKAIYKNEIDAMYTSLKSAADFNAGAFAKACKILEAKVNGHS